MSSYSLFSTAARLALDSIRAHKLRSFLTLLGIIIGVASVILVGSAIDGLGAYAENLTAREFGSESYLIAQVASAGRLTRKQLVDKQRTNKRIRAEDVAYLRAMTGDRIIYSPYQQRFDDVRAEGRLFEGAVILGSSASLAEIRNIPVADGRFFTDSEERMRQPVAIVGDDIREALFPGASPLGRKIKISGVDFTVVGLLERQGSAFGRSLDTPVYIPFPVYVQIFGGPNSVSLFGKARPGTGLEMEDALDLTRVTLRNRFKTQVGKDDNFDTLTPDSVRSFVDQILGVIAAVVVPVTSISLVVGGIVVMNIMLVSVTERTREIGIRKSLGATQRDIMLQFLTEAVILSATGGVLGLAAGALVVAVLSAATGAALQVAPLYIFLSIFVSSATGIVSGWYPARRASRMDPVEALRAE
jgi:putative ABC transport system permease protein